MEGIQAIIEKIRLDQGQSIETAVKLITEPEVQDGVVHMFRTGHSNIISEKVFTRADTLAPVNHVGDLSMAGWE